jgi:hypothetical protein
MLKASWVVPVVTYFFAAMFLFMAIYPSLAFAQPIAPYYVVVNGVYSLLGVFTITVGNLLWAQAKRIESLAKRIEALEGKLSEQQ